MSTHIQPTAQEAGTCPECFGYANCQYVCPDVGDEYIIPCSTTKQLPMNSVASSLDGYYFRMVELFSGGRLLPGILSTAEDDPEEPLDEEVTPSSSTVTPSDITPPSGWLFLAHSNNRAGQANIESYDSTILVNVVEADIKTVSLVFNEASGLYSEDTGDQVSYNKPCMFIVKIGDLFYRLNAIGGIQQGSLIQIEAWPDTPIKNIEPDKTFTIYPGDDPNWETNAEAVVYGRPFFVQIGERTGDTINILTTSQVDSSGNCSMNGNYKKLSFLTYNVVQERLFDIYQRNAATSSGLYPASTALPVQINVATDLTCDFSYYSIWFIAQPALDEGVDMCKLNQPSSASSLTWLWYLLGAVGGIIVIILLVLGIKSLKGKGTSSRTRGRVPGMLVPRQSLPRANVMQAYPTYPGVSSSYPDLSSLFRV